MPKEQAVPSAVLYLVRHAAAGDREDWSDDDALRPLTRKGLRQAKALVDAFAKRSVSRILTSPAVRCKQTVQPLATARSLRLEEVAELAEGASPRKCTLLLRDVPDGSVLCTHADVIGYVLDALLSAGVIKRSQFVADKGSVWQLERLEQRLVAAHYIPAP